MFRIRQLEQSSSRAARRLSRRNWLRALGAAGLSLPALDICAPSNATAQAGSNKPRFVLFYLPNGRMADQWLPTTGAQGLEFSGQSSAKFEPFADQLVYVANVNNSSARKAESGESVLGGDHARGTGSCATGVRIPGGGGGKLVNGWSIDQAILDGLKNLGQAGDARYESLQWSSGEPGSCDVDRNACDYVRTISWAGSGNPLRPIINPAAAYEQLFGTIDGLTGEAENRRRGSLSRVLDFVAEQSSTLRMDLSRADQERLDQYFSAATQVQQRISRVAEQPGACVAPNAPGGLDYQDRVPVFMELMALALSCGQTRSLSFMIEFGVSGRIHEFLDSSLGHHSATHTGSARDQVIRIEAWHADQMVDFLSRLQAVAEPDGNTLLDNTLVMFLPSMGPGSGHRHPELSPLLVGGKGLLKTAPTGRLLNFNSSEDSGKFHATVLRAFGIEQNYGTNGVIFGDKGTDTLSDIFV